VIDNKGSQDHLASRGPCFLFLWKTPVWGVCPPVLFVWATKKKGGAGGGGGGPGGGGGQHFLFFFPRAIKLQYGGAAPNPPWLKVVRGHYVASSHRKRLSMNKIWRPPFFFL